MKPATPLELRGMLQKVATGPELSKDLSYEEARAAMTYLLSGDADEVQAGVFLIALRMKRETDDELRGLLDAIRASQNQATCAVDTLIDISDPYNGYSRSLCISPFVLPTLAACGVPSYSHGVESVGPKFGVTHRRVLQMAGIPVDLPVNTLASRIADKNVGWGYADQRQFAPGLHALVDLRNRIVKRPALTTVEVLCGPLRCDGKTHLMTGFVHKPYPPIYTMLARHVGFEGAMLVRGTEGGIVPSLRQKSRTVSYVESDTDVDREFQPIDYGIERQERALIIPQNTPLAALEKDRRGMEFDLTATTHLAVDAGIQALQGTSGLARDAICYAASLVLQHLGRASSATDAMRQASSVLDNGKALACFEAAKQS